jgi:hypothetical protein
MLAVAMIIVAGAAGCAGQARDSNRPPSGRGEAGASPPGPVWTGCEKRDQGFKPGDAGLGVDAGDLAPLGNDFRAVAAVVCGSETEQRLDGSQYLVGTEDRAEDIAALITTLRLPDEAATTRACTADHPTVPWFVLLDEQGRWVRPGIARDECGKQRAEIRAAVKALTLTRVSTWPIEQVRSAESVAAKCGQGMANMVRVRASSGADNWATTVGPLFGNRSPVRLCVYRVPADEQRAKKPVGEFAYGRVLSATRAAAINKMIRETPQASPACDKPTTTFAMLQATTGQEPVFVELDGCRRVLAAPINDPIAALRKASPELLALVTNRGESVNTAW